MKDWAQIRWLRRAEGVSISAIAPRMGISATSRAIARTGVPDDEARMIVARRTRIDSCRPRRTIRPSRCPSSSVKRRARTGSAIACVINPVKVHGHRTIDRFAASLPEAELVALSVDK